MFPFFLTERLNEHEKAKKVQRNVKRKFVLSAGFDKLQLCDLILFVDVNTYK